MYITDNSRILSREELPTPEEVINEVPLDKESSKLVFGARRNISRILHGLDDRIIAVVGPCSIHDPESAIEYAKLLKEFSSEVEDEVLLVMRVYFEKPRTTIGWKGLINDPRLDNSFKINEGLRIARKLLKDIHETVRHCRYQLPLNVCRTVQPNAWLYVTLFAVVTKLLNVVI